MSVTYPQAKDEIFNTFFSYWDANVLSALSYKPEVRWEDKEEVSPPDTTKHHIRIFHKQPFGKQSALKSTNKLFEYKGFVVVQLYLSKATLNGSEGDDMAVIALDSFRKATATNVWYRDSKILPTTPEEDYFRIDVMSDYVYTEAI